jgi:ATP diphosphatase
MPLQSSSSPSALVRAHVQGQEAARVGFDWPDVAGVVEKVEEEWAELRQAMAGGDPAEVEAELGDLLMALTCLGRHLGCPAEQALESAMARFLCRYAGMEALAAARGQSLEGLSPAELDGLWREAKRCSSLSQPGD